MKGRQEIAGFFYALNSRIPQKQMSLIHEKAEEDYPVTKNQVHAPADQSP